MSRSGLTVPGRLVTAIGEWASPCLCRHARASSYILKHKENQRKPDGWSDSTIQYQEAFKGNKEAVLEGNQERS
ncbi:hypothetical protein F2Q68_00025561 [Brassica cretica]|uniref:Uncharacterized protein n=1 Tax=Brassica cretica TaxID=69181 RepID=A0A8S9IED3_BRACR|nr:hypothetical protein F2Q68_00025561 [Brassica cretica]